MSEMSPEMSLRTFIQCSVFEPPAEAIAEAHANLTGILNELTRLRAEVERLGRQKRTACRVADKLAARLRDRNTEIERLRRVEEAATRFVFHHDKSRSEQANAGTPLLHTNLAAHWLSQLSTALSAKPATGEGDA